MSEKCVCAGNCGNNRRGNEATTTTGGICCAGGCGSGGLAAGGWHAFFFFSAAKKYFEVESSDAVVCASVDFKTKTGFFGNPERKPYPLFFRPQFFRLTT